LKVYSGELKTPLRDESIDMVLLYDVLHSYYFSADERKKETPILCTPQAGEVLNPKIHGPISLKGKVSKRPEMSKE